MTAELLLRTAGVQPPLKWAGGKRWLLPHVADRFPRYQRFVEPCMGAMAMTLGVSPTNALVNDINPHLVNFFKQIQSGLIFKLPYMHNEEDYYNARDRFNENICGGEIYTAEMANLFYYLNRTGFNGLCRFNRQGLFNVPFGRYATINYRSDFKDIENVIKYYNITEGDFSTLAYADGDFIYADPPYDTQFTSYSKDEFAWEEQVRLAQFYSDLGLSVLVSNQATPRILSLYNDLGYRVETLPAPRRISSSGDRSPALEMLAWKY